MGRSSLISLVVSRWGGGVVKCGPPEDGAGDAGDGGRMWGKAIVSHGHGPAASEMGMALMFTCIPGPLLVSQYAASEPSGNARMEESNRLAPCVIVRGVDQRPPLDLTANFRAYPFSAFDWTGSIQLR